MGQADPQTLWEVSFFRRKKKEEEEVINEDWKEFLSSLSLSNENEREREGEKYVGRDDFPFHSARGELVDFFYSISSVSAFDENKNSRRFPNWIFLEKFDLLPTDDFYHSRRLKTTRRRKKDNS